MAGPVAKYVFLSWLRRGVGTAIEPRESEAPAAARVKVPVTVAFNAGALSATVPLELFGAGEVTGFDPRVVIRVWPRPDVFDAESNYFPLIEFDQPDLPWRLTPARAEVNDRLRPWLALIALKEDEATIAPATGSGDPPVITVDSAASLPDLAQAWAWSHAQVSGETELSPGELAQTLSQEPWRVTSRMVCPRQLEPDTTYLACLVPALERGRLPGLRLPLTDAVSGLQPAWTPDATRIRLPVYYRWRFRTADAGDFEALVRRLVPRVLPSTVGIRDMDVSNPGGALANVPAHDAPLGLEGALKAVTTQSTVWTPSPTRTRFVDRLKTLLNIPAALLKGTTPTRAVTPPLYGRWHAAQETLQPGQPPPWFQELNQDPRLRVTAGLGTLVVQQEQRSLMNEAWRQIDDIKRINEELRLAQLARALAERLHIRHLATAGAAEVVQLTTAVHARIKASPTTVAALLGKSPIPPGVLQGQLRRVTRPAGPLLRRIARVAPPIVPRAVSARTQGAAPSVASRLVDRMNTGALRAAPPPVTPAELPTTAHLASTLAPNFQQPFDEVRTLPRWLVILILFVVLVSLVALGPWVVLAALALGIAVAVLAPAVTRAFIAALRDNLTGARPPVETINERLTALQNEQMTSGLIASSIANPAFQLQTEPPLGSAPVSTPRAPIGATTDSAGARIFRGAAADLFGELSVAPAAVDPRTSVDVTAIGGTLVAALTPRVTIAAAFKHRLVIAPDLPWQPSDPIEPVMAYPKFDRPMYEPLRGLGQDWLLPGLDQIPPNTVTLMLANQRFIEAYMTGLNHEMSRELRWNEYLTDLRGSYFRQFWDVRGAEPSPGQALDPEQLKDIREIHTWPKTSQLGQNSPRPPVSPGEERLVLVVRGDLVRRYPNTEVYALQAIVGDGPKRNLGEARQNPIFRGTLRPDLFFFGFNLTPKSAIGGTEPTNPQADQGWFFVLEEQPAEPRFGLDVATTFGGDVNDWNNLSWGNLAASANDLAQIRHVDLDAQLPDSRPIVDVNQPVWHADTGLGRTGSRSADLASITLQRPVRVAIHASDILPRTS
jgi:hypothetical protein